MKREIKDMAFECPSLARFARFHDSCVSRARRAWRRVKYRLRRVTFRFKMLNLGLMRRESPYDTGSVEE